MRTFCRPECLGPALRAGGKGLLEAVAEAIDLQHAHNAMMLVSAQQAEGKDGADYDPSTTSWDNQSAMNASSGGGDSASAKKEHLRNISMLNNIELVSSYTTYTNVFLLSTSTNQRLSVN